MDLLDEVGVNLQVSSVLELKACMLTILPFPCDVLGRDSTVSTSLQY